MMALMHINKKATWALADFLYFFFYVGLTFVIALLVVKIPDNHLNAMLQTGNLEQTVDNDRMSAMLAYKNPYSGRLDFNKISSAGLVNNQTVQDLLIFPKKRKVALMLGIDGKSFYFHKDYYEIAKPLAPVRYVSLVNKRFVEAQDDKSWKTLMIEQVYKKE